MNSKLANSRFSENLKIASIASWCYPPENIMLGDDEVHVWRATLNLKPPFLQRLLQTLSSDERDRAEHFYFYKDREHFIAARGLLRSILGRYLDITPEQLQFCNNFYGKPSLAIKYGATALRFNSSHSHGIALYAVARCWEVGIDIEYIQPAAVDEQIAERFFSSKEVNLLRALPPNIRTKTFFTCWTRKEAYIKVRGTGLALPLNKFEISLTPRESPILLSAKGDTQEISHWSLQDLSPGPGYVAALAVQGDSFRLKCWQWPG